MIKSSFFVFVLLFVHNFSFASTEVDTKSLTEFIHFQQDMLENKAPDSKNVQDFYKQSWAFWHINKVDYNQSSKTYIQALNLYYQNKQKFKRSGSRDVNRYKKSIQNFKHYNLRNTTPKESVLFVGSSSIAGWETAGSFPDFSIVNRGLGGMSVPELLHYYDVLIKPHSPKTLVVYCDIDVEMGKKPKVVVDIFKTLVNKVKGDFPNTKILLMAMKPTLIDDFLGKEISENKKITNQMLAAYSQTDANLHFIDITKPMLNSSDILRADIFLDDGMHLNTLGYSLWDPIITEKLLSFK